MLGGQGKCYCNHLDQSTQGLSKHNTRSKPDSFTETEYERQTDLKIRILFDL